MAIQTLTEDSRVTEERKTIKDLRSFMKTKGKDFYVNPTKERDILPTGFLSLDEILNGGVRSGTHVEMFGEQSTGKTYLAMNIMAQCQKLWNKPVMYVDFEKSWYPSRAREVGLDLSEDMCAVIEPPTQEQGYDYVKVALQEKVFGVIVIDSMSAMVPEIELEEDMEKTQVAKNARNNSQALRILTSSLKDTIVIFINQLRTNIGVMFGDPTTTTGGKALPFYAHTRLKIAKLARDKEESFVYNAKKGDYEKAKVVTGHIMKITLEKSRSGNATKYCELVYDYNIGGIDQIEDQKAFLFNRGIITKEGMWYTFKGYDKRIKGRNGLDSFMRENQEIVQERIREAKE